jgi:YVTN family beta-propeller protein
MSARIFIVKIKTRLYGLLTTTAILLPLPVYAMAGPFLYIDNLLGNSVTVIDNADNSTVAAIPVSATPTQIVCKPGSRRALAPK